jgi:hypothetical protein
LHDCGTGLKRPGRLTSGGGTRGRDRRDKGGPGRRKMACAGGQDSTCSRDARKVKAGRLGRNIGHARRRTESKVTAASCRVVEHLNSRKVCQDCTHCLPKSFTHSSPNPRYTHTRRTPHGILALRARNSSCFANEMACISVLKDCLGKLQLLKNEL